ncbi:MAG: hypothetical protein AAGU11_12060 [Syntrophobacteraceae bacterium]
MDKDVLDFWGNFFINAAKGQRQLDEMADWSRQALTLWMDWSASFQKLCNLDAFAPVSSPPKESNRFGDDARKSLLDGYLRLWGIKAGPDEHLKLIRKYEELKEKLNLQEETIHHLKLLLEEARRENMALAGTRHRDSHVEQDSHSNKVQSSYQS